MKNQTRILFRIAGGKAKNKHLGLGHTFRTINLAKELQKTNEVYFLIEDFGGVKKILKKYGFTKIKKIQNDINLLQDVRITTRHSKKIKADLLIVDRYKVKKEFLKRMKNKIKTVVITDLRNIDYQADLLVNGFIGYKNRKFKNKFRTLCVVGPLYQIINSKFMKQKKIKKKYTILATFGGLDEKNVSELIVESVEKYFPLIKLKLIVGPIATKSQKINELRKIYPKNIEVQAGTNNMAKEISQAKFGFCSGGLTTYEFAAKKVPFIVICDDSHQLITAGEWHKKKVGINLGLINKNTKRKIQNILEKIILSKKISFSNDDFVDGKGVKRVSNEILKIIKKECN